MVKRPSARRERRTLTCHACPTRERCEWHLLPDEAVDAIDRVKVAVRYEPGDIVVHQGTPCRAVYCVESGLLAQRRTDEDGHTLLTRLVPAGVVFGFQAFFGHGEHGSSAECLEGGVVCHIDGEVVRGLTAEHPPLTKTLLQRLAGEADTAESALLESATDSVRMRLARLLLTFSRHYGVSTEGPGGHAMKLPVSRNNLSEMLGVRPETVSRALGDMEREGLIEISGRSVTIPDVGRLHGECGALEN